MEEIKFKVVCKNLDQTVSVINTTLSDENVFTFEEEPDPEDENDPN